MHVPFFDIGAQVAGYREALHVKLDAAIDSGQFIGGELVSEFENSFAGYLGVRNCVGVGNGLDALRLCLEVSGIGPGDEVIIPAFTFYATWLAVIQLGAIPVPVDVDLKSANLDVLLVEEAITPNTKAIIAVHLYGWPANMLALDTIAKKHGVLLFEDAAQSHGAMHRNKMSGSWGSMAAFSFYPTKNLGALGDAGCVTTNNDSLASAVRSRRSYGQGTSKYDHISTGWNTRLDSLQAGILSYHLTRLDEWTESRRRIAATYRSAIDNNGLISLGPDSIHESVWHHFVIRVSSRGQAQDWFASKGINTDIHYPYAAYGLEPVKPFLQEIYHETKFAASDDLAKSVLSLPIGPWMTEEQVKAVADVLNKIPDEFICA